MSFYFVNSQLQQAETIILGVPYDRSSSYVPGSRFAPQFIRIGADNIETYSPYFNRHITDIKIYDAGDIVLTYPSIRETFQQIQKEVAKYIIENKKLISLGGEHTITVPIIMELSKLYPDLYLIQLDAHTDTRDSYLEEKYCHATVIRRISEIIPANHIFQLGLRSLTGSAKKNQYLFSVAKYLNTIKQKIGKKPCYLTLDIDVLDSGIMPAVQTAVPGGISYQELFQSIVKMSSLNIVACDLVEYNPLASPNLGYASIMSEIMRELIIMMSVNKLK